MTKLTSEDFFSDPVSQVLYFRLDGAWVLVQDAISQVDDVLANKLKLALDNYKPAVVALPAVVAEPSESEPRLIVRDGKVFANSREVAEVFGKEHKNVLQSIKSLDCSANFNRLNFQPVEYLDGKGETRPAIDMTRDGLTFLVMGFTGPKAAIFKEKYIEAFNKMEAELRNRTPALDLTTVPGLTALALQLTNQNIELKEKVAVMGPKAIVHDRIVAEEDDLAISHVAKMLGVPQREFFNALKHIGWIFKRSGGNLWLPYADKEEVGWLKLKEVKDERGKMRRQTVVTPLGLSVLAKTTSFPVTQ